MTTYVKLPPPRQLTQNETLESLEHWKSCFRNYFRRDAIFKTFLASDYKWDPSHPTYALKDTENMTAIELKDALVDFLNNLAGFLPNSYLTVKLERDTKCLADCWDLIEEHYNVKVTPETLLDFESIEKEPAENFRQFYERLLQHANLHLAPADTTVGNLKVDKKEEMYISIMNFNH